MLLIHQQKLTADKIQLNKRKKLKDLINEGKAELLAGKTPCTVGRVDEAYSDL